MRQESHWKLSKLQSESAWFQQKEIFRKLARQKLLHFTKYTKPDFRSSWHHVLMCNKLEEFVFGDLRFLMVFAPPRHTKSELVSRRLPAFIHGHYPSDKIMAGSYSKSLAVDMTGDVQKIMDTPEYHELFPNSMIVPAGGRHSLAKRNTEEHDIFDADGILTGGKYRGQGVGGAFTGKGANWIIIDDPIKGREAANSVVFRDKLWKFYTADLRTRLQKGGKVLITLTRWHEDDLAGRIIAKMKEDPNFDRFEILNLPAIKEVQPTANDPRKVDEALWPQEYDIPALKAIKAGSTRDFIALFQQRPSPQEGSIITRDQWKFYTSPPSRDKFEQIIQSWDLTFKGKKTSDWVVGQIWGKIGADKYLLDQFRDKVGFNGQIRAIQTMTAKWPEAMAKIIEDAANCAAIIETLQKKIPGLIAVPARTSKKARAEAISPQAESGNIWLPDPSIAPWIHDYIEEWAVFTGNDDREDDQVDATSQGVLRLSDGVSFDWGPVSVKKQSTWKK